MHQMVHCNMAMCCAGQHILNGASSFCYCSAALIAKYCPPHATASPHQGNRLHAPDDSNLLAVKAAEGRWPHQHHSSHGRQERIRLAGGGCRSDLPPVALLCLDIVHCPAACLSMMPCSVKFEGILCLQAASWCMCSWRQQGEDTVLSGCGLPGVESQKASLTLRT